MNDDFDPGPAPDPDAYPAEDMIDPPRLPEYLERDGVEEAVEDVRRMLRYSLPSVPDMSDTELLRNAIGAERAARDWPPDGTARLFAFVFRAEVHSRYVRSVREDRRRLFVRKAEKAGYVHHDHT